MQSTVGPATYGSENSRGVRGITRILIVDDHPVVTETLSALIDQQDDLEVCGVASSAEEALKLIETRAPDAAIVDISLDGTDGLELIGTARSRDRHLRLLVLSRHDESLYGERAARAGAQGYLTKRQALTQVLTALRQILDGDVYFSDELKDRLFRAAVEGHHEENPVDRLSDREFEVYRLVGQGHGTRQIAERLHLTTSTVETHRRNIRRKMDLDSSRELMVQAIHWWDRQQE